MKATAYTIVSASDENELIDIVAKMLQNGWQPQGGISVTTSHVQDDYCGHTEFAFFQAMVMPE